MTANQEQAPHDSNQPASKAEAIPLANEKMTVEKAEQLELLLVSPQQKVKNRRTQVEVNTVIMDVSSVPDSSLPPG